REPGEPLDGREARRIPRLLLLPSSGHGSPPARAVQGPPAVPAHRRVLREVRRRGLRSGLRHPAAGVLRAHAAPGLRQTSADHVPHSRTGVIAPFIRYDGTAVPKTPCRLALP